MGEVTFTSQGIVIIGVLLTALVGCIGTLFKLLMSAKDNEIIAVRKELGEQKTNAEKERDQYKETTRESIMMLQKAINELRSIRGLGDLPDISGSFPQLHSRDATIPDAKAALMTSASVLDVPSPLLGQVKDIDSKEEIRQIKGYLERVNTEIKAVRQYVDHVSQEVKGVKEDVHELKRRQPSEDSAEGI